MATSLGAPLFPVRLPPPSYTEAVQCPATANGDHQNTSKTTEHASLPRDKNSMFSMLMPKSGCDVRLPPALYYHRNSDPLLHRRSQSQMEEFGDICLLAKARRRSEKDFLRNGRIGGHKNCILNHSPSIFPQRRGSTPLCNGHIPSFQLNGIPKGSGFSGATPDLAMHDTSHDTTASSEIDDLLRSDCDINKSGNCDLKCDSIDGSADQNGFRFELDDFSLEHAEHSKLRCEESLTIDIPELFQSSLMGDNDKETDSLENTCQLHLNISDETAVKNIDISPRVLCNGALLTSNSDQDIAISETHPFILRDDSISGSESNCSVKHSVSWQKPRPLSSLSIASSDNTVSLPGSLERHLAVARNNSGSGSDANSSVKPVFVNKNPVSNFSSRSCSPQPGPSGYDVKFKRTAKKTVTYSDTVEAKVSDDSSQNITYQNSMGIENMQLLDEEIKQIEREGSKANRGTIYCACGIFAAVIGAILIFVLMMKSSIP